MGITAARQSMSVNDAQALIDADFDEVVAVFDEGVDLDKMWAGVAWVLRRCGAAVDPIQGASEMIGEDFGYGPIPFFPPEQVASVANSLAQVDDAALAVAFDLEGLQRDDVYPNIWNRPDEIDIGRDLAWLHDRIRCCV
jgi:hypothetical protein